MVSWADVLRAWEAGRGPAYPSRLTGQFYYETSVCRQPLASSPYKAKFFAMKPQLPTMDQRPFQAYLTGLRAAGIAFPALSSPDTILIIPRAVRGTNYTTLKEFLDQAPAAQQRQFWKLVAKQVKRYLRTHAQVYVSTHGLGVHYFHLRLDPIPKYYHHWAHG